ncbi:phosphonoacetaldehyde hydrolase [Jeongeupia naejangsanensis]|uniref:Phosphonoacetaldehyde hydrolase n=1 Tax=Jeongeupia naejangsanensis TaxID=613195 RepID=A0ABS2BIH7_9NEIS|nr:phosphonoacetaldehyde hydrolase [Jeongeupia naejangsanensis]MBM3115407.1 phosphonoacetaldehyde hydrolase [Jeongeupia naejangsanensis]
MNYRYTRRYAGKLQAVIFDWAGTVVDFGSFAPTQVLIDALAGFGIDVHLAEARVPMGLAKWDHIRALGDMPQVAARWQTRYGRAMSNGDVDAVYEAFMPLQVARVGQYSQLIPGALETIAVLRAQGIRIGSCSGYPRIVMDTLLPIARERGYSPDCTIATDDLPAGGRPGPWMALENVNRLAIADVAACVKVDDTVPGIAEGLAAGMWTIGLSASGNEVGLTHEEWTALSPAEQAARRAPAEAKLYAAGAHFVVDSIADLPAVIDEINARLARGERP